MILKSIYAIKIFVYAGIFLVFYTLAGCDYVEEKKSSGNLVVDLNGDWKFSIGDDSSWVSADYNDDDWEEIKVPSNWENEGYYGYNGFAWYRKSFEIPNEYENDDLYLNLGYIDDVDETYLNGTLIGLSGGFPPYFLSAYTALRKYYIPKSLLRKGENIIAVRVYDIQLEGGIIKGAIGIYCPSKGDTYSADLMPEINLIGAWKFKTGDNIEWKKAETNDTSWKEIFVPAYWEAQGFGGYDGFAWYRKSFMLPKKYAGKKMVLLMGRIDDMDQTYVNGQLVGFVGNWNFDVFPENYNQNNEWQTLRAYFIPKGILKPGEKNLVSVRVYDGFLDGGIYDGPIGLIEQEKYVEYWKAKNQK